MLLLQNWGQMYRLRKKATDNSTDRDRICVCVFMFGYSGFGENRKNVIVHSLLDVKIIHFVTNDFSVELYFQGHKFLTLFFSSNLFSSCLFMLFLGEKYSRMYLGLEFL